MASKTLLSTLALWRDSGRQWPRDCPLDTTPLDDEARNLSVDLVMNPDLAQVIDRREVLSLLARALGPGEE